MLDSLAPSFLEPYATAPTQPEEAKTGYDVRVVGQKTALFQFKRAGPSKNSYEFYLDPQQYWTFRAYCGSRNKGFYVLPLMRTEADLQAALVTGTYFNRITYIDVFDVPPWTNGVERVGGDWVAHGYPDAPLANHDWGWVRAGLVRCLVGSILLERQAGQGDLTLTEEGRLVSSRLEVFQDLSREFNRLLRGEAREMAPETLEDFIGRLFSAGAIEGDEDRVRAKQWFSPILRGDYIARRPMGLGNWGLYEAHVLSLPMQAGKHTAPASGATVKPA